MAHRWPILGASFFPEPGPAAPRTYIHSMVLRGSELNFMLPMFASLSLFAQCHFQAKKTTEDPSLKEVLKAAASAS